MNGLSQSLRNPDAVKVLFSLHPLPQDEILKADLSISDKETYGAVSYTHLLIENSSCHITPVIVDWSPEVKYCLLYTSRCV